MSEVLQIVTTAGITVVVGSMVYAVSKHWIDPVVEQKRIIGKIAAALMSYEGDGPASVGREVASSVRKRLRELAESLLAAGYATPTYGLVARTGWVRPWVSICEASKYLLHLSYFAIHGEDRRNDLAALRAKIRELLGLRTE